MKPTALEWCDAVAASRSRVTVSFKMRIEDSDATWGGSVRFGDPNGNYWAATIDSGNGVVVAKQGSGSPGSSNVGNLVAGFDKATWYNVTLTGMNCSATSYVGVTFDGIGGSSVSNIAWGTTSGALTMTTVSVWAGSSVYIDDLQVTGFKEAVGAAATTDPFPAGFSLVGFDEDYAQKTVIARLQEENTGRQQICTFDPVTLNVITCIEDGFADEGDMACMFVSDGVMAIWEESTSTPYVGFLSCNGSDGLDVDTLSIRSSALGPPSHAGTLCDPAVGGQENFCNVDLVRELTAPNCPVNDGEINPDASQIGQVMAVPISYAAGVDKSGVHDYVNLGFVYATSDLPTNSVGSFVQSQINDFEDFSCWDEKQYSAANITDICAFRGNRHDDADYVMASATAANVITWRLTHETRVQPGVVAFDQENEYLIPHMAQISQLQTGIQGIGCSSFSNSSLLIDSQGRVNRYNIIGPSLGEPLWEEDLTGGITSLPRGVTMSRDGNYGAYARSDLKWNVFHANNGTAPAEGALPSGDYFGMRLSGAGNDLVIATSDQIARYHVTEYTNGVNRPDNVVCDSAGQNCEALNSDGTPADGLTPGSDDDDAIGGGLPGVDEEAFATAMGISQDAGGWILGMLFIVALGGGLASVHPGLGVVGAIFGTGMTVALDLIPLWAIAVLVLLGAAVIVLLGFRRGG